MGIYDRDYIRERQPTPGAYGRAGLSAMRMWTVNTWLIVICCGVFVLDALSPIQYQQTDHAIHSDRVPDLPDVAVAAGPVHTWPEPALIDHPAVIPPFRAWRYLVERPGSDNRIGVVEMLPMPTLTRWLHFSTALGFLKLEVWRFIGFQFLHANIWHLLFNMVGLFVFGPLVERYLGAKRYLAFYLLCGVFGAILYLLLNLAGFIVQSRYGASHVPFLLFDSPFTPLVGASAGIFGVLMAGAYLAPRDELLLFLFLPIRQDVLAYVLVGGAFFSLLLQGQNAGGEAGHLGGAAAGWYFIRHTKYLHGFFDFVGWADPTSHHYRGGRGRDGGGGRSEVDRILDKIQARGLQSLTAREKRILREATDRR